jgi:hypothetical protein
MAVVTMLLQDLMASQGQAVPGMELGEQQLKKKKEEARQRLGRMSSRMGSLLKVLRRLLRILEVYLQGIHYKFKILGIQEAQVLREAKPRLGRPGRGKAHGANETGTMVSGKTESGLLVIGGVLIGVGVNGATPTTQSLT